MNIEDYINKEAQIHMGTYARLPVLFVKGKGTHLWDASGREYLDFVGGLGVSSIGHCHPSVVEAVKNQVEKL
ncbi:MAG: aminotransferase class III-fold pyridoxal phosphate-dependent enzyme, partial [Candidatus Subteraquimicrobiales bacterium]|nr:aminotransferase class III-fold pyridoxal phosphate-dependent enzyme [Candidatus Subteraquimicrobiales bacterium]